MRWTVIVIGMVVGCGKDTRANLPDAPPPGDIDAATDASAMPDAAPLTLDCASYCSAITANCTGAQKQYESQANCLASCSHITTAGALTDTMVNTLGCRLYHTDLARTDPATHCEHAGPSGGDACGSSCLAACDVIAELCPALTANQWQNNCANNCPSLGSLAGAYSTTAAMSGNTVECRLYYATAGNCAAASRTSSTLCL